MTSVLSIPSSLPRVRRVRNREEDGIQASIVSFVRLILPKVQCFSIPNGAGRIGVAAGRRLKAMGLLAGVPDVAIVARGGLIYFLEVKTNEGRASQVQRDFAKWCEVNHVPHAIVRGVEDTQKQLVGWGLLRGVIA